MKLPNLSYMVKVGQVRTIQARYEPPEHQNPDNVAARLLPLGERLGVVLRGGLFLRRMRSQPFYSFVLARTRYYDRVFLDAIDQGARYIVNIGCGSDTRAYRFRDALERRDVRVVECDQPAAIEAKRRIAGRELGPNDRLDYLPIDLNDDAWPALEGWFTAHVGARMLVMLEGVSPYVGTESFERFLAFLTTHLVAGSTLAYDFKHTGAARDFGRTARTQQPFRLAADRTTVGHFHALRGFTLESFESSVELSNRLVPRLADYAAGRFDEDCLVRLSVGSAAAVA